MLPALVAAHSPEPLFLTQLAASTDPRIKRWANQSLAELVDFAGSNPHEAELLYWYFDTFCTGWGFTLKGADGKIFKNAYRLTPNRVADRLGLIDGQPKYFGISPANETLWAYVDIDTESRYHPASEDGEGIEPVIDALRAIGLKRPVELQSSHTTGVHLCYGLNKPVKTWILMESLVATAKAANLEIKDGVLEFFPNKKHFDSAYKCIRAPLSGEGNATWVHGMGLDDSPEIFRHLFIKSRCRNKFTPLKPVSQLIEERSTNTRGHTLNSESLESIQSRLSEGFSSSGQTQELQFAALQVARFVEGASSINEMRKRATELLSSAPGFSQYCGHRKEIENGSYWSNSTFRQTLKFSPADYDESWWKIANDRKAETSRQQALNALGRAFEEGVRYSTRSAALMGLRIDYGAPVKSWFYKNGKSLLSEVDQLVSRQQQLDTYQ